MAEDEEVTRRGGSAGWVPARSVQAACSRRTPRTKLSCRVLASPRCSSCTPLVRCWSPWPR
eukprot:scaffold3768_cov376-Prasinococcus_capsulatus_cf.AAC.26